MGAVEMRVSMYAPSQLYGFCEGLLGKQAFFYVDLFEKGSFENNPPPIVGESVLVEFPQVDPRKKDQVPRASRVIRTQQPLLCTGVVDSFNSNTGWGFVMANGVCYYLHRSEILDGRLPLPGMTVSFYAGNKRDRPRACHVKVG